MSHAAPVTSATLFVRSVAKLNSVPKRRPVPPRVLDSRVHSILMSVDSSLKSLPGCLSEVSVLRGAISELVRLSTAKGPPAARAMSVWEGWEAFRASIFDLVWHTGLDACPFVVRR
jgi:hypothetical protein